jgi:hypothetical protein
MYPVFFFQYAQMELITFMKTRFILLRSGG